MSLQLQPLEIDNTSNCKLCEAEIADSDSRHLSLTGSRGQLTTAPVNIHDIDTNSEKLRRPGTLGEGEVGLECSHCIQGDPAFS